MNNYYYHEKSGLYFTSVLTCLIYLLNKSYSKTEYMKIKVLSTHKDFEYMDIDSKTIDEYTIDNNLILTSSTYNISIKLSDVAQLDILMSFSNDILTIDTYSMKYTVASKAQKILQNVQAPKSVGINKQIVKEVKTNTPNEDFNIKDTLNSLKNIASEINKESCIAKVKLPEENKKLEKDEHMMRKSNYNKLSHSYSNNSIDSDSIIDDESCESDENDNKNDEIDEDLKNMSEVFMKSIEELEKKRKEDEENLSKFYCMTQDKVRNLEKQQEKDQEKLNIYNSAKTFTYPTILKRYLDPEIFNFDLSKVPILFKTEFLIFLFMDGLDYRGNTVREKLLGTSDEYEIYCMLYSSLAYTDDFIEPLDQRYLDILEEFIDVLPDDPIITKDKLTEELNTKIKPENAQIFTNTFCEKEEECDE